MDTFKRARALNSLTMALMVQDLECLLKLLKDLVDLRES